MSSGEETQLATPKTSPQGGFSRPGLPERRQGEHLSSMPPKKPSGQPQDKSPANGPGSAQGKGHGKKGDPTRFIQLDMFAAPAPAPKWSLERVLYLLDPAGAELIVLHLGLKMRRRHGIGEIASVTGKGQREVEIALQASYEILKERRPEIHPEETDADLATLMEYLAKN